MEYPVDWQHLVVEYGYLGILIGTLLEGEVIVIIGGFMAHRHYLELPLVMLFAFTGTLISDQLFYYIGRIKGRPYIDSRPHWQVRTEKVFSLLHKYPVLLVLGFRFMYGLRTITPLAIGASNFPPLKYLILNTIGAGIWAIVVSTLGYLIGDMILRHGKQYELTVVIAMCVIGVLVWGGYKIRYRLEARRRLLRRKKRQKSG
ncbi:Inner membrane protein YohD [BD1-7 clade bacterium]|uniref:Inner membrane protein YohD n=1 Tax=BD1-7 clade bacterium TaxID=2029982 RepID=A0A5S9MUV8_9GAMM|nr:Inner membrane protein YohD [BD1-7 clade bacterium]